MIALNGFRGLMAGVVAGVLSLGGMAAARDDHESQPRRTVLGVAAEAGKFRTLLNLVYVADLVGPLTSNGESFTVFAPTDEAFDKLPKGTFESLLKPENRKQLVTILTYHVVSGKILAKDIGEKASPKTLNGGRLTIVANGHGIAVNEATVIQADVPARNGVIHVIDRVLTPSKPGVLGVAEKAGNFSTLLAAIKAAKLEDALSGDGPFTVFAPTDEAFAKLPADQLKALLKPGNREALQAILKYHVVEGKVSARDAIRAGSARTLQGGKVEADIKDGRLIINDARALATDIPAENGVIHVIDSVLIPKH